MYIYKAICHCNGTDYRITVVLLYFNYVLNIFIRFYYRQLFLSTEAIYCFHLPHAPLEKMLRNLIQIVGKVICIQIIQ